MANLRAVIPGVLHHLNGKRRKLRQNMATGGPELPVVYRWAYDYSVPGEAQDFIPQNEPPNGHAAGFDPEHPDEEPH